LDAWRHTDASAGIDVLAGHARMQKFIDQGAGRFGAAGDRGHIHHPKSFADVYDRRSLVRSERLLPMHF
jgi:hypothetical protein